MWAFLDDPTAAGGGFISTLLLLISGALKVVDYLKKRDMARMQRVPPTIPPPSTNPLDVQTGKFLIAQIERANCETALQREKWTAEELRQELQKARQELQQTGSDHAKTAGALVVARETITVHERTIDRKNEELRVLRVKLEAARAQKATAEAAAAERDVQIGKLLAELARKERELKACEAARDETRITPLRPPALKPKEST